MILKQRYDRPFTELANDFENIIEHVFGDASTGSPGWSPRADVFESESGYTIEMELPGIEPEAVSVELKNGSLEISGEKQLAEEVDGRRGLRQERRSVHSNALLNLQPH